MKDELIKFETAKLAKERGFTEGCGWLLHKDNDGSYTNCDDLGYNQPTQSLLQRWLREVHNIDIFLFKGKNGYYTQAYQLDLNTENLNFSTYEEALEVGLFEALKLINNEKDNK